MKALLRAISGLIVWSAAFSSIYGLQGLVCALGWQAVAIGPFSLGRVLLVLVYLSWLALHLWLLRQLWRLRRAPELIDRVAAGLAVVGLVATAYTGFPVAVTTTCAG